MLARLGLSGGPHHRLHCPEEGTVFNCARRSVLLETGVVLIEHLPLFLYPYLDLKQGYKYELMPAHLLYDRALSVAGTNGPI